MRLDIAEAWSKVSNKTGKKRDIRKLPEYLNDGERVLAMTGGRVANNLGLLVATDRRALFISEGIINHSFEDFPYDRITTITSSRGMVLGKIVVHTGGAARVVDQVAKGEAEAVAAVIRERVEAATRQRNQPSPTLAQPTNGQPISIASELRELAELRDAGVLTPEEFATQKARLLAG
jgi:hypothetical protein